MVLHGQGLVFWCGVFYGFFWLFGILVCVAFRLRVSWVVGLGCDCGV